MSVKSVFIAGAVATALAVGGVYTIANLQTVPAGYVGVKVNLYGSDKGVQNEELGVGRYLLTWNEQCYLFPTFNQLHTYKVPFTFQTSDAMAVNARIGVEYQVKPSMATKVFQTYRKGVDEITDVNLRQNVSDALIKYASLMDVNELTANGKTKLLEHVTEELRRQLEDVGIHIIRVSWASDIEYPPQVRESINAKIEATQRAMLRENEVAQSKAEAEKARVAAQGEADAQLTKAKAEAESIAIRAKALRDNPQVLTLEAISRWDGKLPVYLGGDSLPAPFMQMKERKSNE